MIFTTRTSSLHISNVDNCSLVTAPASSVLSFLDLIDSSMAGHQQMGSQSTLHQAGSVSSVSSAQGTKRVRLAKKHYSQVHGSWEREHLLTFLQCGYVCFVNFVVTIWNWKVHEKQLFLKVPLFLGEGVCIKLTRVDIFGKKIIFANNI